MGVDQRGRVYMDLRARSVEHSRIRELGERRERGRLCSFRRNELADVNADAECE